MRRILGVLALAALLTGCASPGTTPSTAPSPTAAATVAPSVLIDAMTKAMATTATVEADIVLAGRKITASGQVDAPGGKMAMVLSEADLEVRVIGQDFYAKLPGVRSKPWAHFDLSRLRKDSQLLAVTDFTRYMGILSGVVTVESTGPGQYRGVADLNKAAAAPGNEGLKDDVDVAKDPGNIPFEASVDAEGRLTKVSFTIETKAMGNADTTLTLGSFGRPVTITAPPAKDTEEAPESLYSQF
jgi:hypothetical protein